MCARAQMWAVHVHVCACMHIHLEDRGQPQVSFLRSLVSCFQNLTIELGAHQLGEVDQQATEIHFFLLSQSWNQKRASPCLAFKVGAGIKMFP